MKYILTAALVLLPVVTFAQYTPLVGIPGVTAGSFNSYMTALYGLSISIAALLAVIKIIIGGVKWMMTDIVPNKSAAKQDIQGAVIGLLVILAAVLILTVINPNLGKVNVSTPQVPTVPPPVIPGVITNPVTPTSNTLYSSVPLNAPNAQSFLSNCGTSNLTVASSQLAICFNSSYSRVILNDNTSLPICGGQNSTGCQQHINNQRLNCSGGSLGTGMGPGAQHVVDPTNSNIYYCLVP